MPLILLLLIATAANLACRNLVVLPIALLPDLFETLWSWVLLAIAMLGLLWCLGD